MATDDDVAALLGARGTWAVVGCSPDPWRDSHRVAGFLQRHGYRVIPVNPLVDGEILGERVHPSVEAIPADVEVDVVDVFRRSEAAGRFADEAVAVGAKGVWFQLGVLDHEAFRRTTEAGVPMVMDTCPAMEWPTLG